MDMFKAVFLSFFACVLCSLSIAVPSIYAEQACNFEENLAITLDKNTASVKNNSTECSFTITLAAYDMPFGKDSHPEWISAQKLLDYQTVTLAPGEEKSFSVSDASSKYCRIQTDLFRGSTVLEPPFYENNLADAIYSKNCEPEVTPSPTPTATPVASPTPSATPVVQTAITPPATGGDGRSDGLGCAQNDCSGNRVGGASVLGVSTTPGRGGVLPFTGTEEGPWLFLAIGIAGLMSGIGLHLMANKLQK